MKKRTILYTGLLATTVLSLAACGGGDSKDDSKSSSTEKSGKLASKQVINTVMPQEMPTADPSLSTDVVSAEAIVNSYEGVYRLNQKNELELAGATDVEVSKDGMSYTIKLRKDAKWSNGDPVTAKDYVFAWQRTVDPATASEYAYIMEPVKNAAEITAGKKPKSELGIEAVNDYELKVTLAKPTSYFKYLLSFPNYYPLNQKVVEKYGKAYGTSSEKGAYNGPFVLADLDGSSDQTWSYKKNNQYWDKKHVKLDQVNVTVIKESSTSLNLFQEGKQDDVILTGELAQQMADDPAFISERQASVYYLELNQMKEDSPFRNKNLRKAISYAIDRKSLAEQIIADGSVPAKSVVPAKMSANPKTKTDFVKDADLSAPSNLKKARSYWKKAQKELGINKLKFDILCSDTDISKKAVEYIQGAIEDALPGVKVTTSAVPLSVRLDRSKNGDFDATMGGWSADYPDPSSFLDLFTTGNSYNRGRYSNEEYDKLIKAATNTDANDEEKRWDDYVKAAQLLQKDAGVIPIYQKAEAHLRNEKLKDVAIHPTGAHHEYKWAYLEN